VFVGKALMKGRKMAMVVKPPQSHLAPCPLVKAPDALQVAGVLEVTVRLSLLGTPLDKAVYFGLGRRRAPGR
jgi:hypothetical protein